MQQKIAVDSFQLKTHWRLRDRRVWEIGSNHPLLGRDSQLFKMGFVTHSVSDKRLDKGDFFSSDLYSLYFIIYSPPLAEEEDEQVVVVDSSNAALWSGSSERESTLSLFPLSYEGELFRLMRSTDCNPLSSSPSAASISFSLLRAPGRQSNHLFRLANAG